jgi:cell division protein FtsW (lipid II flippase)
MTIDHKQPPRHRVRDYLLYIAISLALVGMIFALARSNVPEPAFKKWFAFAFYTAFVFGFVIEKSRAARRKRAFWIFMVVVLAIQYCVFLMFIPRVDKANLVWIAASIAEVYILRRIANWLVRPTPSPP